MKGIRKLFYGFVLLALFCVGFKIEAKAALDPDLIVPKTSGKEDWKTDRKLTSQLGFVSADFPVINSPADGNWASFSYDFYIVDTTTSTKDLGNLGDKFTVELLTEYHGTTPEPEYTVIVKDKNGNALAEYGPSSATDIEADSPVEINRFQIGDVRTAIKKGTKDASNNYTEVVKLTTETPPEVTKSAAALVINNIPGAGSVNSDPLPLKLYALTASSTTNPTVNYTIANDGYLLPGESTTVTASKTADNNVKTNGNEVMYQPIGTWNSANSKVTFSDETNTTVTVTMKTGTDGGNDDVHAEYGTVKMSLSLAGESLDPGDISSTKTLTETTADGATVYSKEGAVKVTKIELVNTSGGTLNEVTTYSWPGTTSPFNFTYTVPSAIASGTYRMKITTADGTFITTDTMTVSNPALDNTVKVTVGQNVKLSRYISGIYTTVKPKDDYVTVAKSGTDWNITGYKSTSASSKKGLVLDGTEKDVIVYKKPDLDFDTSSTSATLKVEMPTSVYHDNIGWDGVEYAAIAIISDKREKGDWWAYKLKKGSGETRTLELDWLELSERIKDVVKDSSDSDKIDIYAFPVDPSDKKNYDEKVYDSETEIKVNKVKLDGSEGATYTINDKDVGDYFYAMEGMEYKIVAKNKSGYSNTIDKWEGVSFGTNTSGSKKFTESTTIKAFFKSNSSSSSSSSSTGRNTATNGESTGSGDYDDVPKTGESKTDIWILWSVLMISILGAGFMIWKRFGLARAIAEADEQVAIAEHEEQVKAEKKAKKDKLDMLKDLRNL